MSRLSLFNSPLLLGFEHFERALDRVNKISSDGYPPYNVEQLGENELRITLAVAGFTMADLSITVEDNQLVIRGKQTDEGERIYLHRGIAARQFQRSFVLAHRLAAYPTQQISPLLNVGSSTSEFRERIQPWMTRHLFAPLQQRGVEIVHLDCRSGDGIDICADLLDDEDYARASARRYRALLCCNILEHVRDPGQFARRCVALVVLGGLIVVTVPRS